MHIGMWIVSVLHRLQTAKFGSNILITQELATTDKTSEVGNG